MISKNFKNRIFTSMLLLLIVILIFQINLFFVYTLIVLGVLSILEFFDITKKIIKKKINYFLINFVFLFYLFIFCIVLLFFYNHFQLKIAMFLILLCCIASDIGGFLFGKLFKGPKLTKISPNKTIIGAIGSIVLSCLVSLFIFKILSNDLIFKALIIGSTTSVACQIGDLFFSYLKRKAKIKDTGSFLPGHGGILDRLDGILLGVPAGIFIITYLS